MRTDRLKATALAIEIAMIAQACVPQGTAPVDATPPPGDPEKTMVAPAVETIVPPTNSIEDLPDGQPLTEKDRDTFLASCLNCEELGITKENVDGAVFGDGYLFHSKSGEADYFFLWKTGDQLQQLDWTATPDGNNILHSIPEEGQTADQLEYYFAWNPKIRDAAGGIVVTYQSTGKPDSAASYSIPADTGLYHAASYNLDANDPHPINAPATPVPAFTPTPVPATRTPEPTPTREVSYNCPVNPESANMSKVSLVADIQSGKLAKWTLEQPAAKNPIVKDRSKIDYTLEIGKTTQVAFLGAQRTDNPGWSAKFSQYIGTCIINPSEFGLEGKNDMALLISVMEDSIGTKLPVFGLTTLEEAKAMFATGALTDPANQIYAMDSINLGWDPHLVEKGAEPNGPADFRPLVKMINDAQGVSRDEVQGTFKDIADSNPVKFSDRAKKLFSRFVFWGKPGGTSYDN